MLSERADFVQFRILMHYQLEILNLKKVTVTHSPKNTGISVLRISTLS